MDKETAIKILDHRTYKETIAQFETYKGFTGEQARALAVLDACEMAISALRAQPPPSELDRGQREMWECCSECN